MNTPSAYHSYFNQAHDVVRKRVRNFIDSEVKPYIDEWEENEQIPRELHYRAAELGILGIGFPDSCGGLSGDVFFQVAANEEIARAGSCGLSASLASHALALPPIVRDGTDEQKEKFVKPVLLGKKIAAVAISETERGSDVANITTTAVRDGDFYIVNGKKDFVTCGGRADQITCAVRTGGEGAHGISLLVIEAGTPGYSVKRGRKFMGWWSAEIVEIELKDCRVPISNRIGNENEGFYSIMANFQMERLHLSVIANTSSQVAYEEAMAYSKEREVFGKEIFNYQVTQHKLVDMLTLLEATKAFTYQVAAKIGAGIDQTKEIAMVKNFACDASNKIIYDAVQLFGGKGYVRGYVVERLFRDNRALAIGGGTSEIMKEIVAKFML